MTESTFDIAAAIASVSADIRRLEQIYQRKPNSVQLLAVSKTKPVSDIQRAVSAGQIAFGENYPDEAARKIEALADQPIDWHFIGAIQSRKAAGIARRFSWVHSVDRLKVAQKLSDNRPADMPPLQVCLQVNIDNEPSKSGVRPDQLPDLAAGCAALPGLALRGLMAIPKPRNDIEGQRDAFAQVRNLLATLALQYPGMDTLSMGMSGDLEAAIAEGATIVRIGTALFGARQTGRIAP